MKALLHLPIYSILTTRRLERYLDGVFGVLVECGLEMGHTGQFGMAMVEFWL